jgi:hypothetical protein
MAWDLAQVGGWRVEVGGWRLEVGGWSKTQKLQTTKTNSKRICRMLNLR